MKKEADKMRRQAVAMQRRTAGADSLTTSCLILAAMNWILMSSVVGELVIKDQDFPPRFIHQPHSVELLVASPHTIECPVEAQPPAEVRWFKDDQALAMKPSHLDQAGLELMFVALSEHDSGQYFCRAQNYLGSATSEPFSLHVQTAVRDPSVKLEPALVQVAPEQQAQFTCSLAVAPQEAGLLPEWRRNGRRLLVKWLDEHEEPAEARSRLVARRTGPGEYLLSLLRVHTKDDNATFTCQLAASGGVGLARESQPARLRVLAPPPSLDSTPESPRQPDNQRNSSTSSPGLELSQRHRLSLYETLEDLFELTKPGLLLVGLLLCSALLLTLLVQALRRRSANCYSKQAAAGQLYTPGGTSSSSCLSAGAPGSSGFESETSEPTGQASLLRDPVLSSLMGRTLLGPGAPLAGAKQRSYRDIWRKVAAADLSGQSAADQQQAHLFRAPNLYNQSLAAREQARSLLQASEHMRSLGNLSAPRSQHHKHLKGARANSALSKAFNLHQQLASQANGSHLNLPLSFGLAGPNEWGQHEDDHYQLVSCDQSSSESSVSGGSLIGKLAQQRQAGNHYSIIESAGHDQADATASHWSRLSGRNVSTGCQGSRQSAMSQQQLSPYAVSSICAPSAIPAPPGPPPPPVNSEAMRALTEQFDINQLMLLDQSQQQEAKSAALQLFESSPPPPPPPPIRQPKDSPVG